MTGQAISPRRAIPWFALAIGVMLLAACETDKTSSRSTWSGGPPGAPPAPPRAQRFDPGTYKVGSPYQVEGKWYYPKVDLTYDERGVASWYGPNFHGKKTANGEVFDMALISAAHKTLPMPSVVRVTNLENGRSLIIRLNDRGPFVRGRIIDLSRRAAELLGFSNKGTAMVHVRLLPEESRRAALEAGASGKSLMAFGAPAPKAAPSIPVSVEVLAPVEGFAVSMPPPYGAMTAITSTDQNAPAQPTPVEPPTNDEVVQPAPINVAALPSHEQVVVLPVGNQPNIFVQAGAFREYVNANRLRARLTVLGHQVNVSQVYVTNQPFFRVRLGPLPTVEDADMALDRVVALGYPGAQIVVD